MSTYRGRAYYENRSGDKITARFGFFTQLGVAESWAESQARALNDRNDGRQYYPEAREWGVDEEMRNGKDLKVGQID